MTQQEILDYNKMCIELLPFNYRNQAKYWIIYKHDDNSFFGKNRKYLPVNNLQFHSDWNWMMCIIEKILNICLDLDSMEMYYNITDAVPDKEAAVQAINQFLIWYNEQSKEKA